MKAIYKILIAIFLICYLGAIALLLKPQIRTRYCGKVTSVYRTDAAYKVSSQAHVVFYCDSLKRKVDVKVSNNTYANTVVGESLCFRLSESDLKD